MNFKGINFFTITRKYWKEQLIFYLLTTLSFLFSFTIKQNGLETLFKLVKTESSKQMDFKLFWKKIHTFQTWKSFAWLLAGIVVVYVLIVMAHVYYRHYFANQIIYDLKQNLVNKFLKLNQNGTPKEALNVLTYDTRSFADLVIFVPNQIFLIILSAIFTFIGLSKAQNNFVLLAGISYFTLIILICLGLNYLLYKKDLLFKERLEKQSKKENDLVNNRDLIIKKNLFFPFQKEYKQTVSQTRKVANQGDFFYTSSFVLPSYFFIPLAQLIFLPFMKGGESFVALEMLLKLFDELKKMIERLWNYPYYFSAKKRLNQFIQQKERDDWQNRVIIAEPVESITFQRVSFAYEPSRPVLQKIDLKFSKGQVNHLRGENGFGKSTIINLLVGLYKTEKGKIVINNRYQLSDLNLHAWRAKIAYAEHNNLIEENFSTGQKQLADLNQLFTQSKEKEIFIFDEADNSLDETNRKGFYQKLEKLSRNKIVILVAH
jgi:ATP-binding cassette subfamily B multidrug efflux pump